MAEASRKHFGKGARGKGAGAGAMTELEVEKIPDSGVLSNRDKSQNDKDRGLDGKETETEELRDHAMNGLDDPKSEPVAGLRAAFFLLAKPRRQPVEEARQGNQRKREADAARELATRHGHKPRPRRRSPTRRR
jgi:hypothetical protein